MAQGVLVLLGSGETAPGMTKIHRELLGRLDPVRAINLDTAYGFQENVPQMTEKLVDYFTTSLQTPLLPVHFTSYEQTSELERTIVKQQVRDANYVFAGPGSPSYALSQWRPLGLVDDLRHVLVSGGVLCFSSAAVVTLGAFTAPIYEIYKVGSSLFWLEGLDLMSTLGLSCVTIPHFDNNEGGNYDTRFCYLGERRLQLLEERLPEDVATLGIDEHTALVFDLDRDTVNVRGRAHGYWRHHGTVTVLANGSTTPLEQLRGPAPATVPVATEAPSTTAADALELGAQVLEGGPNATEALARLVQLALTGSDGHVEAAPLVEGVLAARRAAKQEGHYAIADSLREVLTSAGIEVQDTSTGTNWSFRA